MYKNNKYGFGILGAIILIFVFGAVIASGLYVYSKNTTKQNNLNSNEDAKVKTHTVLAVGDIACDPSYKNFNNAEGQNGECQHKAVVDQMNKQNAELSLLLGDIQYNDGAFSKFEKSFVPVYKTLNTPMVVAAGNHDWQSGTLDGYLQAFSKYFPKAKVQDAGKTYFTSNVGDWMVYVLDSDCDLVGGCKKGSEQYNWFESQLKTDTSKCSIAMWHHPIVTSGLHKADDKSKLPFDLYELADTYGVDVVLVGHDHNYERFAKQDVNLALNEKSPRTFVVGTGGAPLRPLTQPYASGHEAGFSEYGFLKLNLTESAYNWQFVGVDGATKDSGSDKCF